MYRFRSVTYNPMISSLNVPNVPSAPSAPNVPNAPTLLTAPSAPTLPTAPSARINLAYFPTYARAQRKCSLCKSTSHIITTCNDETAKNKLIDFEDRFHALMITRLHQSNMIYHEYTTLIKEICDTKQKYLKYFMSQFGGYSNLNTKRKLYSFFIFHLVRKFLLRMDGLENLLTNVPERNLRILHAERSYWLYLSAGNSVETAENIYSMRIREILNKTKSNKLNINVIQLVNDTEDDKTEHKENESFECVICFDICMPETKVVYDCSHIFCGTCVETSLQLNKENNSVPCCALCRNEYSSIIVENPELLSKLCSVISS